MERRRKVLAWILALSLCISGIPAAGATTVGTSEGTSTFVAMAAQEGEEIVIPQSQMSATADSSASGEGADKAIDGNNNTKWHSSWSDGHPVCPLSITLNLGEQYDDVYQLRYLPRQDSSNGNPQYNGTILGYEISVSNDGDVFTKVAEGTWDANRDLKTASFNATGAHYVRLTAISSMGNNDFEYDQFASAAEINIVRKADFVVDKAELQEAAKEGRAFLDSYKGDPEQIVSLTAAVEKAEEMLSSDKLFTQEEFDAAAESIQTALKDVAPATEPTLIPQENMTATADTQEKGNEASKAIDGNTGTWWHSNWTNYTQLPHYITLDLGKTYTDVYQMKYLPRQDKDWNGTILKYAISASENGEDFTTVATGEWEPTKDEKTASFTPVTARYLRLTAYTSENNEEKSFASAAEINVVRLNDFTIDTSMLPPAIQEAESFIESFEGKESLLDDLKALVARAEALLDSTTPTQEEFISLKNLIEEEIERIESIGNLKSFTPGDLWLDTEGDFIQAHGGGILYDEKSETYYWYGENKDVDNDPGTTRTPVIGVSCYSSKDLYNWKYEGLALDPELQTGEYADELDPENVLERPKVIYNDTTGKYVMWAHIDSADYSKACAGVAVSDSPTGPFTYIRSERPNGQMSRDMTLFKDDDGKAYLIYSSENNATLYISQLSDDYLSQSGTYTRNFVNQSREAPAMFKHDGKYYIITSGCTGWSPNAAGYGVADSPLGPFEELLPNPCVGTDANLTFRGQSTHVLPVEGYPDKFIFMADRWNANNLQDSRYLWLPLQFNDDGTLRIEWMDEWDLSFFGANWTELTKVQEEAAKLTESDYTAESWEKLQEALEDAAALPKDAPQEAVDEAVKAIRTAIDELEEIEPSEKTIVIRYSGRHASLAVNEKEQPLADLIGVYSVPASEEALTLRFTPTNGREFAGVQVNGTAVEESAFEKDAYVVEISAEEAAKGLDHLYEFTIVDKENLREVITIAESENVKAQVEAAVPSVQKKYKEALQAAKAIEEKKTASQDEINNAMFELIEALQYLSFTAGDKSQLEIPMEIAESINRENFTPESVQALDDAYKAAEDLMDDEEVLEADIQAAAEALYEALDNLVFRADMTDLEALVAEGKEIVKNASKYIQDNEWSVFVTVLGEAEDLLENDNATQEAVDEKAEELLNAITALRMIPNKDALKDLIGKAEAVNTSKYTAKSVAAMQKALSNAKVVLNNEAATEEEVKSAVEALEASIQNLETKTTTAKKSGSTSRNVSNTYGAAGVVSASQSAVASVRSDAANAITLNRGSMYTFKMTVVNGNGLAPSFTVGNGSVLKTQFVSQIGNDYYYRVYAVGTPGQSTGVYTTLPGQNAKLHCTVTIA